MRLKIKYCYTRVYGSIGSFLFRLEELIMATHDRYDNDILKQLTRIANALERISKRLPEEYDTAEYGKEHLDWAEKVEKMASGDYVQVTRCKDCKHFILLEDMKNDPYFKDHPFDTAEYIHAGGLCKNIDKWVYTNDFCSEIIGKNRSKNILLNE